MRRLSALAAIGLLGLAACGAEPSPPALPAANPLPGRPSILFVTIDTLRRDHLGCYGYPRPTSPHLDALARESVVFERAVATMATTFPSHLSMLTGQLPDRHGWLSNGQAAMHPYSASRECLSVAVTLRNAGWNTAAFVSAPPVSARTGIDAGFEHFDDPAMFVINGNVRFEERPAPETTRRALTWLENNGDEPFFVWIHYWDVHEPNAPGAEQRALFQADEAVRARLRECGADPALIPAEFSRGETCARLFPDEAEAIEARVAAGGPGVGADELAGLVDRYDADVRTVDEELGRLFERLRELGRWDDTLVAVTADHGQALGDAAWIGHDRLMPATYYVPLIVRLPAAAGVAPGRIDRTVSLADLFPTLLARLDARDREVWFAQAQGQDLFSGSFRASEALVRRTDRELEATPPADRWALVGDWELLWERDGPVWLSDLRSDPHALHDVRAEHPEVVSALAQRARALGAGAPPREPAATRSPDTGDAELLRELERLGYTGD